MTAQTWLAAQPDAALDTAPRPDAEQSGATQTGATQQGTPQHRPIANWARSLSHLIPGHDTMQALELEQLVLELTCTTRATRPVQGRRWRSR
jgi:hypothetical protein